MRILSLAAVLSLGIAAANGQTVQVSIVDTTAKKGDTLLIPIRLPVGLTGTDSVYSGEMSLSYNSGVLNIIGIETSGTLSDSPVSTAFNPTTRMLAFASANAVVGSGVFVYLRTVVRPNPSSDTTTIFFGSAVLNEGNPTITLDPGFFRILSIAVSPKSPSLLVVGDSLQFSVSGDEIPPLVWTSSDTTVGTVDSTGKLKALAAGNLKIYVQDAQGLADSTSLFPVYPAQAADLTLSIHDTSHTQTLEFNLPIYVSDVTGLNIISAQWTLNFNSSRLQGIDVVTDGSMTSSWSAPSFSISSGQVEVAMAGAQPLSGSGILAYVRLRVLPAASGVSTVNITGALFNEDLTANTVSGQFTPLTAPIVVVAPNTVRVLRDESVQFSVTSGGTPPYQWSASNPVVASIDQSTGLLTALARGTTTVTVVDSLGFSGTSGTVIVNDVRVTLPDTAVWPLDSIDVPVNVDDLTGLGIYSFEIRIRHDSSSVELLSVIQAGTISAPFSVFYQDTLDTLRIAGAGTAPLSGGGVLLKLRFKASMGVLPPVTGPLEFTKCEFNEPGMSTPTALTQNGSLSVVAEAEIPVLAVPSDGSTDIPFATTLVWNSSAGAAYYRIQLSEDSTFATSLLDSAGVPDTATSVSGLSPNTRYFWRVSAGNLGGWSLFSEAWSFTTMVLVSVEDVTGRPGEFQLTQNYPNPFNPSTSIRFDLPVQSVVRLTAYDVTGNEIAVLLSGLKDAGVHRASFDASNLASGVYFCRFEAVPVDGRPTFQRTMKMILLR